MSQNPLNLAVRFFLELGALYAFGYWGWTQYESAMQYLLAIGLPLLAATFWGTFRVPADASANGKAPVPVPGWLRFLLELTFFTFAAWCLFNAGAVRAGTIFSGLALIHNLISYDRVLWLFKQQEII
jgi:hypothetical protein